MSPIGGYGGYTHTNGVWLGHVNVKAPNGYLVPVDKSELATVRVREHDYSAESYTYKFTDQRDEVATADIPAQSALNDIAYRALPGINYSAWGFIKIGRVWVDPYNAIDVQVAIARANKENTPQSCVIL